MDDMMKFQAIVIVCLTVGFIASLQFIRRLIEMRHDRALRSPPDALMERLERIEVAVDATAVEVERISESNRFVAKLLSDRTGQLTPPSKPGKVITPH
jgi:hypothetical protein